MTRPSIRVLAGVNGAGKSSILGALYQGEATTWFNPDTLARELVELGYDQAEANIQAWEYGRSRLEQAIDEGASYAFETTLGGETICELLMRATTTHNVRMLFCGLESPELHLERVRQRVRNGGHDIPQEKIHQRWQSSRQNLVKLLPHLALLRVFDNSRTTKEGERPQPPRLLLDMRHKRLLTPQANDVAALQAMPDWAKPIVEVALQLAGSP